MKLEELLNKLHREQGLIKKGFWYFQKDNGHVIQSFNIPTHINKEDVNFSGTAEKSIWKAEEICVDFKIKCSYGRDIIDGVSRPAVALPVQTKILMTPKAGGSTYEQFIANGWDDDQLVENGYATRINDDRLNNDLRWSPLINDGPVIELPERVCVFEPVTQDNVNHPDHYTQGGIECIDAIAAATVGKTGIEAACVANIIKYLWRYERKNGVEDIKKAQWYMNKLLETKTDDK